MHSEPTLQQPQASTTVQSQLDVRPPSLAFSEDMGYEELAVWLTNHPQFVGVDCQQDINVLKGIIACATRLYIHVQFHFVHAPI